MTRDEQIITEAKKHYNDINCFNAFVHGVGWAELHPIDVWRDASEEPKFGEDVIAIDIDGVSVAGVYKDYNGKGIYRYHCFLCEWDAVNKWAYTSDLLPKGGEK